jgi:hypothetical protein
MSFDDPAVKTGLLNNVLRLNRFAFDCNFKFKTVFLQTNEVETKLGLYDFSLYKEECGFICSLRISTPLHLFRPNLARW